MEEGRGGWRKKGGREIVGQDVGGDRGEEERRERRGEGMERKKGERREG